ncbi:hypothetical protein [Cryobacterium sp. BB736]|uniref:hypothetical protein n=1 Tax=Cryobacterium sp. BB736 TaxID=2746963 RepID=UPI0018743C83|nr:hypothetical protein [Cryobacterium sp. BB736]
MNTTTEFREGDLVEAVNGDTVIRGRLARDNFANDLGIRAASYNLRPLARDGFTITVIERAMPELPTDHGVYQAANGTTWTLFRNGDWFDNGDGSIAVQWSAHEFADTHGVLPFVRLEPVSVTAKKVLDALGEYLDGQLTGRTKNDIIGHLRDEFGVTDDSK